MVAYARLNLNAHTPLQIYIGFLIGVLGLGGFIMIF
jgi:membrane-associated phospholipid phosphatase